MKRVILVVLIASLSAVPMFAQDTERNAPCAGLTSAQVVSLEHVNGEWQMKIKCAQGSGIIAMTDAAHFHGDGLFNGWTEAKMREVYVALTVNERPVELLQLG